MDIETKIKRDMMELGCTSHYKIALAFHLYIHLVDEKLMYDTEYCYNKDIDTLYVVAKPSKQANLNIYVPVSTSEQISMESITNIQENLCTIETGPTVNLAFIDGDFSTAIYTFTKDIAPRQTPEKAKEQIMKRDRRSFINSELYKRRDTILDDALNGGSVEQHSGE